MKTIKIGIIGAGRIGRVHAENIAKFVPEMEIKTIADPYMSEEAAEFLRRLLQNHVGPLHDGLRGGAEGLCRRGHQRYAHPGHRRGRPVSHSDRRRRHEIPERGAACQALRNRVSFPCRGVNAQ